MDRQRDGETNTQRKGETEKRRYEETERQRNGEIERERQNMIQREREKKCLTKCRYFIKYLKNFPNQPNIVTCRKNAVAFDKPMPYSFCS